MALSDRRYTKMTTAERVLPQEAYGQRSRWPDRSYNDPVHVEWPPLPWSTVNSTEFAGFDFSQEQDILRQWIEAVSMIAERAAHQSTSSQASSSTQARPVARPLRLSSELSLRLKELVFRDTNWDLSDARQIRPEVAQRVEDLALAALAVGVGEPEVTAASDGSLGVDWNVSEGVVIGLFVSDTETWEPVAIITDDDVRETSISSIDDLMSLLARYSRQS